MFDREGIVRGAYLAFVTGGFVFFTTLANTQDLVALVSITGAAVFSVLGGRAGVEGYIDKRRADGGQS